MKTIFLQSNLIFPIPDTVQANLPCQRCGSHGEVGAWVLSFEIEGLGMAS